MPLNVNVGLSKKISRDYQSTGLSVNLTAELDATRHHSLCGERVALLRRRLIV
jgi:hypothetical protein